MKKETRKRILKKTFEILATPVDIVLFTLLTIFEIGTAEKKTMLYLQRQTEKLFLNEKDRILRNAIYRARHKK